MGFRFEFDQVNKILLLRVEGRLTDELLAEYYAAIGKYSTATDARTGIWDLSSITEFAVTSDLSPCAGESGTCHAGCIPASPIYSCSDHGWFWPSSHVSNAGRGYEAAPESSTYRRRGVSSTRHPIPALRAFRVTERVGWVLPLLQSAVKELELAARLKAK